MPAIVPVSFLRPDAAFLTLTGTLTNASEVHTDKDSKASPVATRFQIDRMSAEPYYLQLMSWIEREIAEERFKVGDALPSEPDLCRQVGLSRHTVRETLRLLRERGRVRIVQRRGAFVAEPPA